MRSLWAALTLLLALSLLLGQQPAVPAPKIEILPGTSDVLMAAFKDIMNVPEAHRPFFRYLWVRDGTLPSLRGDVFALNVVSRGSGPYRPEIIKDRGVLLLRLDLRAVAPKERDLKEWLKIWEDFQFDPSFSLFTTPGSLKFAVASFPDWEGQGWVCRSRKVAEDCPPYVHTDGHTYTARWVKKVVGAVEKFKLKEVQDAELIRIPAPDLNQTLWAQLVLLTGSLAPVVSDDYFVARALAAIEDRGIYAQIYGGRYYQLAGIRQTREKNATDEDQIFEDLGVGDIKGGKKAIDILNALRGDRRVAVFRSQVTGGPRQVEFFRTLTGAIDETSGLISVTSDLKTQGIDIDQHPLANLLNFKRDAREGIFEKANGFHGYFLTNGDGKLQAEAPPDVARDHTVPAPHPTRLQSCISCISCHEANGSDGWIEVGNDVKKLLDRRKSGVDIFTDLSIKKAIQSDVIDRLARLYSGNPERALQKGRDDYAAAVLKATGPWEEDKAGQTTVVKLAATRVVQQWRKYFYDLVTPQTALRELGIAVGDAKDAEKILFSLLPPDKRAAVAVPELGDVLIPEDPRIAALRCGVSIGRFDWDLTRAFVAERVQRQLLKGR